MISFKVRVSPGRFFARGLGATHIQLTSQIVHATEVHLLDSLKSVDDVWRSLSHSIGRWHRDYPATIEIGLAL